MVQEALQHPGPLCKRRSDQRAFRPIIPLAYPQRARQLPMRISRQKHNGTVVVPFCLASAPLGQRAP